METPTAEDVRARSRIDFSAYVAPEPYDVDTDPLTPLVAEAVAYVEQLTCRVPLSDVPDNLAPLAQQAVRMRVEQLVFSETPDTIETAVDDDVQSFTAGSYSETRRDRQGFIKSGALNGWGALDRVLWLLMTQECRDAWVAQQQGGGVAWFDTTEIDYDGTDWEVDPAWEMTGGPTYSYPP